MSPDLWNKIAQVAEHRSQVRTMSKAASAHVPRPTRFHVVATSERDAVEQLSKITNPDTVEISVKVDDDGSPPTKTGAFGSLVTERGATRWTRLRKLTIDWSGGPGPSVFSETTLAWRNPKSVEELSITSLGGDVRVLSAAGPSLKVLRIADCVGLESIRGPVSPKLERLELEDVRLESVAPLPSGVRHVSLDDVLFETAHLFEDLLGTTLRECLGSLRSLRLDHVRGVRWPPNAASWPTGLTRLVLKSPVAAEVAEAALSASRASLRELVLELPVGALRPQAFEGCRHLTSVELLSSSVDHNVYTTPVFAGLRQVLRHAVLHKDTAPQDIDPAFSATRMLTKLTVREVNDYEALPASVLTHPTIQTLDIVACALLLRVNVSSARTLRALTLTHLDLQEFPLGCVAGIGHEPPAASLRSLTLEDVWLETRPVPVEPVATSPPGSGLTHLTIRRCGQWADDEATLSAVVHAARAWGFWDVDVDVSDARSLRSAYTPSANQHV